MPFREPGPPRGKTEKELKIIELRSAIARAEESDDEEEVLLLEAELHAVERGVPFNKDEFLQKHTKSSTKPKHRVLREMQNNPPKHEDDYWHIDAGYRYMNEPHTYDQTFHDILEQSGFTSLREFISQKSLDGKRDLRVLDLFGGAYFLSNLDDVSKIIGVRLKNIDNVILEDYTAAPEQSVGFDRLKQIVNSRKRKIIAGDIMKGDTWRKVKTEGMANNGQGFDLITCRPAGAFWPHGGDNTLVEGRSHDERVREEIFVSLLERAILLLSPGGMLFTEIPQLDIGRKELSEFLKQFKEAKEKIGFEVFIGESEWKIHPGPVVAIRRNNDNL